MITPVLPVYNRTNFSIERGEGMYLFTTDGRKMLDFAAGIAVNSLGHCHPHLVSELKKQAETLWHTSNLYTLPGQQKLAQRLVDNTFADTVFFTNSGAEAVECGIKMVRKYFDETGSPDKYRIITFEGSFHGRTLGTISASGKEKLTKGFEPLLDGFDYLAWGDHEALKRAITEKTAGILIEPIQGEGGIRELPPQCLKGLRKLCDENGLLLFLDEVQCGMGRTGKLFAHEYAEIEPDIMAVAKGIGGGFPLGACLATEKAAKGMTAGTHGSTYGGNPLAMAVGNAVMDVMLKPDFLSNVLAMGELLKNGLLELSKKYPTVLKGVRGKGLILGLETVITNTDLVNKMRENDLLTVAAADNVIRIMPPLNIEKSHIEEALKKIEASVKG